MKTNKKRDTKEIVNQESKKKNIERNKWFDC